MQCNVMMTMFQAVKTWEYFLATSVVLPLWAVTCVEFRSLIVLFLRRLNLFQCWLHTLMIINVFFVQIYATLEILWKSLCYGQQIVFAIVYVSIKHYSLLSMDTSLVKWSNVMYTVQSRWEMQMSMKIEFMENDLYQRASLCGSWS